MGSCESSALRRGVSGMLRRDTRVLRGAHGPVLAMATCCAVLTASAQAQESRRSESQSTDEVVIWGRAEELTGTAQSASEGVVGYADFSTRPLLRVGELVEVVPGAVATAHSGSGKANQYFLRGINLDHGTDFAGYFDGMPVNFRSHAHAQGYLDLNFIIPELIRTVEYRKGTHYAEMGDFSAAGATLFTTYDRLEQGFVEARVGTEDHVRVVGADSQDMGQGTLLYAAEAEFADGPWQLPEDQRKGNLFLKYTDMAGRFDRMLQMTAYTSEWNATDQIPLRAVQSGELSRFGYVDPDLGGESTRIGLTGRLSDDSWSFTGYALYYELNLFSNPTYAMDDTVNGDELEQEDRRWSAGGSASYRHDASFAGRPLIARAGGDLRYDQVGELNLFHTAGRQRLNAIREDEVSELSAAVYASAEIKWTDRFRTIVGARGDFFDFDVESTLAENSGDGTESIFSPKLSAACMLVPGVELYASYGRGFHSNDVRGVTITVDPASGDPAEPVPALVRADGAELGLRWEHGEALRATLTGFWLNLDSELQFVGDAGTSEPKGGSKRHGVELAGFWQPIKPLVFDVTAAKTHARFKHDEGAGTYIPNAIESVIGAGATLVLDSGFTASLRVRHLGPAPLIEDNSVRADSTTLVNLGASYNLGRWLLGVELLNLLDEEANDIEYYFESQLPTETSPVADRHFHPVEPFEVRATVRLNF